MSAAQDTADKQELIELARADTPVSRRSDRRRVG